MLRLRFACPINPWLARFACTVIYVAFVALRTVVPKLDPSPKRLKLAMETDKKRKARLEKIVANTQLRLALETEEERRAKNGLDLIWIEIGFF